MQHYNSFARIVKEHLIITDECENALSGLDKQNYKKADLLMVLAKENLIFIVHTGPYGQHLITINTNGKEMLCNGTSKAVVSLFIAHGTFS